MYNNEDDEKNELNEVYQISLQNEDESESSNNQQKSNVKRTDEQKLFSACLSGNIGTVMDLLKKDINVNYIHLDTNETPFFMASRRGHEAIVELLMADKRVNFNLPDLQKRTPFFIACENGHYSIVKSMLADDRVDTNLKQQSTAQETPAYAASKQAHGKVVELLFAKELAQSQEEYSKNLVKKLKTIAVSLGLLEKGQGNESLPQYKKGQDFNNAINFYAALTNAEKIAKLAQDEYQQCMALLVKAAKECRREISTPSFTVLRGYLMRSRSVRHSEGFKRCNKIIEMGEELLGNENFSKEKTTSSSVTDGNEYGQAASCIGKYLEQLNAINTTLLESKVEGGMFWGSRASLNTWLAELYDNNPQLFGKSDVDKTSKPQDKIAAIIEKFQSMREVNVVEKVESKVLYTSSLN